MRTLLNSIFFTIYYVKKTEFSTKNLWGKLWKQTQKYATIWEKIANKIYPWAGPDIRLKKQKLKISCICIFKELKGFGVK